MANAFPHERRVFAALHAYTRLVRPMMTIRSYSGAGRLFTMTGLGISPAALVDVEKSRHQLMQNPVFTGAIDAFLRQSIAANCVTYTRLLCGLIKRRLQSSSRGTQDRPHDGKEGPRLSYNITPHLAAQLERIICKSDDLWPQDIAYQNLADMAQIEYGQVVTQNGLFLPHPRQDDVVLRAVDRILTIMDVSLDRNPCSFHASLLITVLAIARLLYADFNVDARVPPMGRLCDRLWISDSTLIALPWPSVEFVEGFRERDAGMISTAGWIYLHQISKVLPEQFAIAA